MVQTTAFPTTAMSEATYKGDSDPDPSPAPASSGGDGDGGGDRGGSGPITIDTTYPRSIEGILKLVTVVSMKMEREPAVAIKPKNMRVSGKFEAILCTCEHVERRVRL